MVDASRGDRITVGNILNSVGVAIGHGAKAVVHYFPGQTEALDARNRRTLLDRVHHDWIEGVLERSVHHAALIELGMHFQADAVEHPWGAVVQEAAGHSRSVTAGTPVHGLFEETGRALLILGAPGAGKTITLLELARDAIVQARVDPTAPIPVVLTLASWAHAEQPLAGWVVEELNEKYQVPASLAHRWLEEGTLLLLLDGLDEVRADRRDACVQALNQFRQDHGFVGLVVCSRAAEYAALSSRLALRTAVLLQPLTPEQVDGYLAALGSPVQPIRAALLQNAALREFVSTPLHLSITVLAYRDQPAESLAGGEGIEQQRQHLFSTYVARMFARRAPDQHYGQETTIRWLAWLARTLEHRSETIFHLERLQPDWLPAGAASWRYVLLDRLGSALLVGTAVGLLAGIVGWLPLDERSGALHGLFAGLLFGLVAATVAALFGGKQRTGAPVGGWPMVRRAVLGWLSVGAVAVAIVGLLGGPVAGLDAELAHHLTAGGVPSDVVAFWTGGLTGKLLTGVGGGLIFGLSGALAAGLAGGPSLQPRRITVVETLHWSPAQAARSALGGLVTGLLAGASVGALTGATFGLVGLSLMGPMDGLLAALLLGGVSGLGFGLAGGLGFGILYGTVGGLVGDEVEAKAIPNQGIRRSAHTALWVGIGCGFLYVLIAGLYTAVASGMLENRGYDGLALPLAGLLIGLVPGGFLYALVGALSYGGYACVSHYALRLLLWRSGAMPLDYVPFLNACVDRIFLQQVGGGYIFVHRLLMEYFAALHQEKS
jgi:eukaryotic-like serine/threonine-protein kinase